MCNINFVTKHTHTHTAHPPVSGAQPSAYMNTENITTIPPPTDVMNESDWFSEICRGRRLTGIQRMKNGSLANKYCKRVGVITEYIYILY